MKRSAQLATGIVITLLTAPANAQRLPTDVRPLHYDIMLTPDVARMTFEGREAIRVNVIAATKFLVLNASAISFTKVEIDGKRANVQLDPKNETATLDLGHPIGAGEHLVTIGYQGIIDTRTRGLFALKGLRSTSAMLLTSFEPTNARRVIPSWDEPGIKARYTLSVRVPAGADAISNMPVETRQPGDGGSTIVMFETTPEMSTPLLFVGVGDFRRAASTGGKTSIGIVTQPEDVGLTDFALAEAPKLLGYYNDWFGIAYDLPKLDLIAAPAQLSSGSIENWGAILFSPTSLLIDPVKSTDADRQTVFKTVAHEISHQWFGDLVTWKWWDDLWLSEGFARWMQTRAADDLHPEWGTGLGAQFIIERGKMLDASRASHPIVRPISSGADADAAFDFITYDKTASVLNMIEAYVGRGPFRDGVRAYLRMNAHGSAAEADLWNAVGEAGHKPVGDIARGFTRQAGLPLIRVSPAGKPGRLVVSIGRVRADGRGEADTGGARWLVPVSVVSGQANRSVLLESSVSAYLPVFQGTATVVNAGQAAYARVLYEGSAMTDIERQFARLASVDQTGILLDTTALARAGYTDPAAPLALIGRLSAANAPVVWRAAGEALKAIDRDLAGSPLQAPYRQWAIVRLQPVVKAAMPGSASVVAARRDAISSTLAYLGDPGVLAHAHAILAAPAASADAKRGALGVIARFAVGADLDALFAEIRAMMSPLDRQSAFYALTGVGSADSARRVLEFAVSAKVTDGLLLRMFVAMAAEHADTAWDVLDEQATNGALPFDDQTLCWIAMNLAPRSANPERPAQLAAFLLQHGGNAKDAAFDAAVSAIGDNVRIVSTQRAGISRWLQGLSSKREG